MCIFDFSTLYVSVTANKRTTVSLLMVRKMKNSGRDMAIVGNHAMSKLMPNSCSIHDYVGPMNVYTHVLRALIVTVQLYCDQLTDQSIASIQGTPHTHMTHTDTVKR